MLLSESKVLLLFFIVLVTYRVCVKPSLCLKLNFQHGRCMRTGELMTKKNTKTSSVSGVRSVALRGQNKSNFVSSLLISPRQGSNVARTYYLH